MDHISHVSKMEDLLLPFFTNRQINVVYYTGLLIFRAVADPRNSQKNAKYREIRQKYFQIHVGKTYLILILAIRPVLFTPIVQFVTATSKQRPKTTRRF